MTDALVGPASPLVRDLIVYRGADWLEQLQWCRMVPVQPGDPANWPDPDAKYTLGPAIDLTGYTAVIDWDLPRVGRVVGPPPMSTAAGNITVGPAPTSDSPNMTLSLVRAVTGTLSFRAVGYTLMVTEPNNRRTPWLTGTLTLDGTGR